MTKPIVTLIGSRDISEVEYLKMKELGELCAAYGYIIRSGAAQGADEAAQEGFTSVKGMQSPDMEIYRPTTDKYRSRSMSYYYGFPSAEAGHKAIALVEKYHPKGRQWVKSVDNNTANYRDKSNLAMMCRNAQQVYGFSMDKPTDLVICCSDTLTYDEGFFEIVGAPSTHVSDVKGGTGFAVRTAHGEEGVPVLNVRTGHFDYIKETLLSLQDSK